MEYSDEKKTRYSIDLDDEHRDRLAAIAKTYKVTQGEVIEALLDTVRHIERSSLIDNLLKQKREAKVAFRAQKKADRAPTREAMKQLLNLSPEALQAALQAAKAIEASQ